MDILLATTGSAGDVYPFLELGRALAARGADVALAAPEAFRQRAEGHALRLLPLDAVDRKKPPTTGHARLGRFARRVVASMTLSMTANWRRLARSSTIVPLLRPTYDLIERHVSRNTVVVASGPLLGARIAHDRLGVPLVTVHLSPIAFRSVHRAPIQPPLRLPGWLPVWARRSAYRALDAVVLDPVLAPPINRFRSELGLPPVRRILDQWRHSPQLVLALFPDWFAAPQADWPVATKLTGFVRYRAEASRAAMPVDLGPATSPLIVFTPGSAIRSAHRFFDNANRVCASLNCRGLFLTPYRAQLPATLAPGIRHFDYLPLSDILPHASILVHTGGIGTAAEAMTAGVPQVVMPLKNDQTENASRLEELGVAVVLPASFGAKTLASALSRLLHSEDVSRRCRDAAERIASVDALEQTCRLIEGCRSRGLAVA